MPASKVQPNRPSRQRRPASKRSELRAPPPATSYNDLCEYCMAIAAVQNYMTNGDDPTVVRVGRENRGAYVQGAEFV